MRYAYYLPAFALYPILYAIVTNPGQVAISSIAIALLTVLVCTCAILGTLKFTLRTSWHVAALATTVLLLLFWSYGFVAKELLERPEQSSEVIAWIQSATWIAIAAAALWGVRSVSHKNTTAVTGSLNVAAFVLMLSLTATWLNTDREKAQVKTSISAPQNTITESAGDGNRDIYYIILDGYARADVLQKYYGISNGLSDELRARNFFVANESTSNYNWTFLSLSSSLNMDYVLNLLPRHPGPFSRDRTALYELIRNNAAADFLRKRGYQFVHMQSTWGATKFNRYADRQISCNGLLANDDFLRSLIDASWLRVTNQGVGLDLANCHNAQFESLGKLGQSSRPRFVFAHFLLPHHPYLFDKDGRILRNVTLSEQFEFQKRLWEDRRAYGEQLAYVNKKVTDLVEAILAQSERAPIIIIQSDHGPNLQDGLSEDEQKAVRFANLAAFLLPNAPQDLIPPNVTPVNQFRLIFNHYFAVNFATLPNRKFHSEYLTPFRFEEYEHRDPSNESVGWNIEPGLSTGVMR
jgi:hypothetical protein